MRKVARLWTTEDNMKKLIWDNELSQDNIFHDKIESLMHNMLHNLAESIWWEIYSWGKVKFIGSSTPWWTYSDIAGWIKQQWDDINIWK